MLWAFVGRTPFLPRSPRPSGTTGDTSTLASSDGNAGDHQGTPDDAERSFGDRCFPVRPEQAVALPVVAKLLRRGEKRFCRGKLWPKKLRSNIENGGFFRLFHQSR